jgi:hypothetical protein
MNKGFADLCLTTWLRRRSEDELPRNKHEESGEMRQVYSKARSFRSFKALEPPAAPGDSILHPTALLSDFLERETRLELATLALARRCSTTELLPLEQR